MQLCELFLAFDYVGCNLPSENRICMKCSSSVVEDEFRILFEISCIYLYRMCPEKKKKKKEEEEEEEKVSLHHIQSILSCGFFFSKRKNKFGFLKMCKGSKTYGKP